MGGKYASMLHLLGITSVSWVVDMHPFYTCWGSHLCHGWLICIHSTLVKDHICAMCGWYASILHLLRITPVPWVVDMHPFYTFWWSHLCNIYTYYIHWELCLCHGWMICTHTTVSQITNLSWVGDIHPCHTYWEPCWCHGWAIYTHITLIENRACVMGGWYAPVVYLLIDIHLCHTHWGIYLCHERMICTCTTLIDWYTSMPHRLRNKPVPWVDDMHLYYTYWLINIYATPIEE